MFVDIYGIARIISQNYNNVVLKKERNATSQLMTVHSGMQIRGHCFEFNSLLRL